MFGYFRKAEPSIYDEPIDKVLIELETYGVETPEFETALSHLERLTKLKAEKPERVSPDTMAIVAGNLLGILIMVGYEQKHVMTSKAMGLLHRVK
jgi:hypothetical protein